MKIGYVLLDGCGDRPNPSLNFTTPLDAAYTPNLDRIARSARLGRVITVGRGISPESDIAVFNMLGYAFGSGYPGRGVVEAVGAGLSIEDGDLALRANLASVRGGEILDRRAGRNLTQDEAKALEEEIKSIRLTDAEFEYLATVSYRGVLVIRSGRPLSADISNTDPAYARIGGFGAARATRKGEHALECIPGSGAPAARRSASLVNEFARKSASVLAASKVNRNRSTAGKLPANFILLRDAGDHLPQVRSFEEKYRMKGTALVDMPAEVGIAKILGMRMVKTEDRDDIAEKAKLFRRELREGVVVYVHIKGPDEFGHDGNAVGKKKSVEQIDRDFFSEAAEWIGDARLGVSCDHATPCTIKMHASDPVPLLVTTDLRTDHMRFTEREARRGTLGLLRGKNVLSRVMAPS